MPNTQVDLEFLDRTFINFDDHSYRWIDLKRFSFADRTAPDTTLLGSLIAHWRYRDVYCSADSHERDSQIIHGPYLVTTISPSCSTNFESSFW